MASTVGIFIGASLVTPGSGVLSVCVVESGFCVGLFSILVCVSNLCVGQVHSWQHQCDADAVQDGLTFKSGTISGI